jgi:hypothetical protein
MSGILTRVKIKHIQGADIAYILEKTLLEKIGLQPTKYDRNETFFNIGDIFTIGEDRYKVVNIFTKIFNQTHEPDNYGVNMHRIGENLPFNFQITYEVDNVD